MELIAFSSALGTIICIVVAVKLGVERNPWSIVTAVSAVLLIFVLIWSTEEINSTPREIEVKALQFDTVITTRNQISDTTYIIKYMRYDRLF